MHSKRTANTFKGIDPIYFSTAKPINGIPAKCEQLALYLDEENKIKEPSD